MPSSAQLHQKRISPGSRVQAHRSGWPKCPAVTGELNLSSEVPRNARCHFLTILIALKRLLWLPNEYCWIHKYLAHLIHEGKYRAAKVNPKTVRITRPEQRWTRET